MRKIVPYILLSFVLAILLSTGFYFIQYFAFDAGYANAISLSNIFDNLHITFLISTFIIFISNLLGIKKISTSDKS